MGAPTDFAASRAGRDVRRAGLVAASGGSVVEPAQARRGEPGAGAMERA